MQRVYHQLLTLLVAAGAGLALAASLAAPVQAGEPTGEIGPMNPTMFQCVDKEDETNIIELDTINDIIDNDPSTEFSNCADNFKGVSDFGFDTTDAPLFEGYLKELEDECKEEGGRLEPIRQTRIDGIVYEFHPADPANPAGEWIGVRSRDVPVFARGISFEIMWGTEDDGTFYFDRLGAGPIVLNMGLPPEAHSINPNLVVKSTGQKETLTVFLGFYRGDLPAPTVAQLRTQDGNMLPFAAEEDIVLANRCGLPMPNVGGVQPAQRSNFILVLAAVVLVVLPVGGLLKFRRKISS